MRTLRSCMVAIALASAVLAGCGEPSASPDDEVEAAVNDYAAAVKAKDYSKICDTFTRQVVEQLESLDEGAEGDCTDIVRQLATDETLGRIPDEPKFQSVRVEGDRAQVRIEGSEEAATLVKQNGEWKLDVGAE